MSVFKFKKFDIEQQGCAQKVGTDSMVLGAFAEYKDPERILDIGTGNGVIALMMAQKFRNAEITGIEIQKECAELAQFNFDNSRFKDRVCVLNADVNNCVFTKKFDLIISNPPFFENATESSRIERTTARHQTTLNLFQLMYFAKNNLNAQGAIWLIVPQESTKKLMNYSNESGLVLTKRIKVLGKPTHHKRDILVFVKTNIVSSCTSRSFAIRDSEGNYTEEYKTKTIDFHHSRL